jgi:ribosomal protein L12E/L44/L45/RPP1/RPP2
LSSWTEFCAFFNVDAVEQQLFSVGKEKKDEQEEEQEQEEEEEEEEEETKG